MADNYVYLKTLNDVIVKPRTDLGALDMTTVNGIVVSGSTIGIMDGYINSAYYMSMISGTDAASPDSAYIEGGTMFQLIGGYTVTDEIPPLSDADHTKIPSEYSVRAALDAMAGLGPDLIPGAGITVETIAGSTGGRISVAPGNGIIADLPISGGVSVKPDPQGCVVVTANGVNVNVGSGLEIDANNTLVAVVNSASGLTVGATGIGLTTGNTVELAGGTVNVARAALSETLTGVITGSTVQDDYESVVPSTLRSALSLGQVIDISQCPTNANYFSAASIDNGETWEEFTEQRPFSSIVANSWLSGFLVKGTIQNNIGLSLSNHQSVSADRLYLMRATLKADKACKARWSVYYGSPTGWKTSGKVDIGTTSYTTMWFTASSTYQWMLLISDATGEIILDVAEWRQYDITDLPDDAINYLATRENPDALFRGTLADSLLKHYMLKQDMVAPWTKTISLPDNSNLMVAAGRSYKISYTDARTHDVTAALIPEDAYGWDAHIQMYVKSTANVMFRSPLILMDALTPNTTHNLVVKFRGGTAYVYVDDTDNYI